MSVTDARARLLEHFSTTESQHGDRWSKLWDAGDFLPWDRGQPNPALEDVLSQHVSVLGTATCMRDGAKRTHRAKALVPGCGRGYDVLLLASFGYDAYGLEISESAVKRCREEQQKNRHKYPPRDEAIGAGNVYFMNGDFFKSDEWLSQVRDEHFDLVYDYTFLSALPPSMRPAWSAQLNGLLRPGSDACLVCVEFPTYKDPSSGGPPWALPPEVYLEHLRRPGKEIPYDGSGRIRTKDLGPASEDGLERIEHWQPERTHEIGKGTDWVSIWRHSASN